MPKGSIDLVLDFQSENTNKIIKTSSYKVGYFYESNQAFEKDNEDCLFIHFSGGPLVAGVSDGAGGHPKGKDASSLVAHELSKHFKNNEHQNVTSFIEEANHKVLDMKAGAHATLVLITISDDIFRSYSVGDSEIVIWNRQGSEVYSNIPDSKIGHQIEAGDLSQPESLDAPDRNYVNNMMGDDYLRLEVTSGIPIKRGNTILIGSDGLFDNIDHETLAEVLAKGPFDQSFNSLCEMCKEKQNWKKDDDISFIAIRKS